jgi:hypothetical protein
VKLICRYLFGRFDQNKSGKVLLEDFNEAVISDPNILEIFTLLNKGIYEHFITSKLEEERRSWFMRSTKLVTLLLNSCVAILEEKQNNLDSSPFIGSNIDYRAAHPPNPFVSPDKKSENPLLFSASNMSHEDHLNNERVQKKEKSDFSGGYLIEHERRKQKLHMYDNVFDKHPLQKIELITEGVLHEGRQSEAKYVDSGELSRPPTSATANT